MTASFMDEVYVFHVFCYSLEEAQGLIEDNGHCNFRQLLDEKKRNGSRSHAMRCYSIVSKSTEGTVWQ